MAGKLGAKHTWDNPPEWLQEGRDISHTSESNRKHYERSLKYYRQRLRATGSWTHHEKINALYKECARRRANGEDVVIDHKVPLISPIVCGLECHWNMEIITAYENAKKGNKFWDDCPHEVNGVPEQVELFEACEQFTLFREA